MILGAATKEAFGYYPGELAPKSHKPILATCDNCGKTRIVKKNGYRCFCNSCAQKGKRLSEEHQAKISATLMGKYIGKLNPMFGRTGEKNPNYKGGKIKHLCKQCGKEFYVNRNLIKHGRGIYCSVKCWARAQVHKKRPLMTAPETVFKKVCADNNLPFIFVGDGSLWLGNANPDFIHKTKKIVVEVFGDYFHGQWLGFKNLKYKNTVKGRREQLKAEGYKAIFIWESDLMREDADKFVLRLMRKAKITGGAT